jgi:phosphoserine phosphatase
MPPFASVIFDCDSTLSAIEGIDELARGYKAEIAALTDLAMRGELPLEAVYGKRLAIIRPSRAELERVGRLYVEHLVPGARETVAALRSAGVEVRIVSGGLRPAVLHVAQALGIEESLVFAVDIYFDADGAFAGFEESSPLATQRGKATLVASWSSLPHPSMLVGDGSTDLEAKGVVDCFVAFAGVVARDVVVKNASVVVRDLSLASVAALALSGDVAGFSQFAN